MAQSLNTRHAAIAAAIAAAGLFAMTLHSGSASASVLSCRGNSPQSAFACCEHEVRQNGMPGWMLESGGSCRTAAIVCKSSKGGSYHLTAVSSPTSGDEKCKFEIASDAKGGDHRWIYGSGNDGGKDGGKNGDNNGGKTGNNSPGLR